MPNLLPSVYWLTGLSGAGKTTIGTLLAQYLRHAGYPVVFLDGDELRAMYGDQFGHSYEQRMAASQQYARLCQLLVKQQIHVICATISMFHPIQRWNREHIPGYVEVFVNVPISELQCRDSKQIYSKAPNNIVGLDIPAEYPENPDIVINNYAGMEAKTAVKVIIEYILKHRCALAVT